MTTSRRPLHTRSVTFQGYQRDDGLWEIEAELVDAKPFPYPDRERGLLPPGHPIHHMLLRVAVDDELIVRELACEMRHIPFSYCSGSAENLQQLVGLRFGPGWRRKIDERIGGTAGCAHIRELLYNIATAGFQSIAPYREMLAMQHQAAADHDDAFYLDQCHSWSLQSPVVQRYMPHKAKPSDP